MNEKYSIRKYVELTNDIRIKYVEDGETPEEIIKRIKEKENIVKNYYNDIISFIRDMYRERTWMSDTLKEITISKEYTRIDNNYDFTQFNKDNDGIIVKINNDYPKIVELIEKLYEDNKEIIEKLKEFPGKVKITNIKQGNTVSFSLETKDNIYFRIYRSRYGKDQYEYNIRVTVNKDNFNTLLRYTPKIKDIVPEADNDITDIVNFTKELVSKKSVIEYFDNTIVDIRMDIKHSKRSTSARITVPLWRKGYNVGVLYIDTATYKLSEPNGTETVYEVLKEIQPKSKMFQRIMRRLGKRLEDCPVC